MSDYFFLSESFAAVFVATKKANGNTNGHYRSVLRRVDKLAHPPSEYYGGCATRLDSRLIHPTGIW